MTYRTFRRRLSEATAAHDWLEGLAFVLGLAFLALAVLCAWGLATGIANIGDSEAPPGAPTRRSPAAQAASLSRQSATRLDVRWT